MTKLKIILLALILFSIKSNAQNADKKEQLKALKIAFITNELSLSADEAAKFWPVFNAFEAKQQEIRSTKTKAFLKKITDDELDKMTDKEANTLLSQLDTAEEDLYQNKKKLILNLKNVLSPVKILKLKRAEENFSKKLLLQYRNKE